MVIRGSVPTIYFVSRLRLVSQFLFSNNHILITNTLHTGVNA